MTKRRLCKDCKDLYKKCKDGFTLFFKFPSKTSPPQPRPQIEKRPKPLYSFFLFHLQSIKNAIAGFHQALVVEEAYDTQCDDNED